MTTTPAVRDFGLFVDGGWLDSGQTRDVRLPYDDSLVAHVGEASAESLETALVAAQRATGVMAEMSNAERSDLLYAAQRLIQRDRDEFAQLVCLETGKPIKEARVEVDRCLQTLLEAAQVARNLHGEVIAMDASPIGKGRMAITVREPLGVIGAITPFNVPLNLAMHKVAPALAGGNTVVHKPAEPTPLSALKLAETFHEAGLPAGAYNVVSGSGETIGQALVDDPRVAMISFTGSVAVGKSIRARAGLKKVTLELGGNGAVILEPDADLALAASRTAQGGFSHSGQVCISVQRVYVHERIADEFLERLTAEVKRLQLGHPLDDATDISSLIAQPEAQRVEEWIHEAVQAGAKKLTGGPRQHATIPPTVLTEVPAGTRMACQEVFGPVVAVNRYRDLDEAVRLANDTPYGLQSGIFTNDLRTAFAVARRVKVGGFLINDVPMFRADHMPYGGVKESGIGREGPRYAVEEMTEGKLICWRA